MPKIRFGPSGNSLSFYDEGNKATEQMPKWVSEKGLDAFEYSFGRGIIMSDEKALSIGDALKGYDIAFSVHAPYFINFSNTDSEKIANSFMYVINSAKKLKLIGGRRVIFHPASMGKLSREKAVAVCLENLKRLAEIIEKENLQDMIFCPETMGKHGQIGTPKEVAKMCNISNFYYPCVDFGHVNSFGLGSLKSKEDYRALIENLFADIGEEKTKNMQVHFSKIQYGGKGEIRHLTFEDSVYGPEFSPLAELLHEYEMTPVIICESDGVQAEDAMTMRKIYNDVKI